MFRKKIQKIYGLESAKKKISKALSQLVNVFGFGFLWGFFCNRK